MTGGVPFTELTASDGKPLRFELEEAVSHLLVPDLPTVWSEEHSCGHLEYVALGRFRLLVETAGDLFNGGEISTPSGLRIAVAGADDARRLFARPRDNVGVDEFQLATRAAKIGTHGGFDQLICLPLVREMELLDHQIRTAKTVLRRFRGRALLCDEVGLGKTIEAGLILSELNLRGLARSILVLTPPSLVEQWQGELRRKFSLDFVVYDDPAFRERGIGAWSHFDRIIVSAHTAKREPHRSSIGCRRWDLIIVDEAHHLRNRATQVWKFVNELEKQFILLLTATPVQNNLEELFNLVTLLEPGLLRTSKQFQRQFVDRKDKLTPRNVDELHSLLSEVMVRNRRSTVGLQFTRRWATTLSVQPAPDESALYQEVTAFVKERLGSSMPSLPSSREGEPSGSSKRGGIARMALIALQMALGSSSQAAAATLATMSENAKLDERVRADLFDFSQRAGSLPPGAKLHRVQELLREFQDKIVIFTQFRATQAMLAEQLSRAGHRPVMFHGGLSRMGKEAAIREFRGDARILLCTEVGSEGRNLQFAHAICNFDLPWNPMKIEQRIGRLSRIGQTHDVLVYNLVAAGTIEAAVLHLLDAKLSMFELVIGEIDMILGNLDEEQEFQDLVTDLWAQSSTDDDFTRRMEELGSRLLAAKQAYLKQRAHDDRLFGSRFAPEG
ncbi:MAG: SNF2-related protein [Planctomycetaceae bacterium]